MCIRDSSNAARICQLYVTDDLSFKRDFKWVDGSLPQVLRFVLRNTCLLYTSRCV